MVKTKHEADWSINTPTRTNTSIYSGSGEAIGPAPVAIKVQKHHVIGKQHSNASLAARKNCKTFFRKNTSKISSHLHQSCRRARSPLAASPVPVPREPPPPQRSPVDWHYPCRPAAAVRWRRTGRRPGRVWPRWPAADPAAVGPSPSAPDEPPRPATV